MRRRAAYDDLIEQRHAEGRHLVLYVCFTASAYFDDEFRSTLLWINMMVNFLLFSYDNRVVKLPE